MNNHQPSGRENNTEAVIRRYSDMVYRLAFARMGSKYDADEVYQEVFLRLIRKKPSFQSEEHCKAWLLRVTLNCSNTFLGSVWQRRKQKRRSCAVTSHFKGDSFALP